MGNNNSTESKLAITAGIVGGVVLTVATAGAAAPLVIGAAEGAYAYHEYTTTRDNGGNSGGSQPFFLPQLEAEHLSLLGTGMGVAALASRSRSSENASSPTTCFEKRTIYD